MCAALHQMRWNAFLAMQQQRLQKAVVVVVVVAVAVVDFP